MIIQEFFIIEFIHSYPHFKYNNGIEIDVSKPNSCVKGRDAVRNGSLEGKRNDWQGVVTYPY